MATVYKGEHQGSGDFAVYDTHYEPFNWEDLVQDCHGKNCQSMINGMRGATTRVFAFCGSAHGDRLARSWNERTSHIEVASHFYTNGACVKCTSLVGKGALSILSDKAYGNIAAIFPLDRPDKIAKAFKDIPQLMDWWNDFRLGLV